MSTDAGKKTRLTVQAMLPAKNAALTGSAARFVSTPKT